SYSFLNLATGSYTLTVNKPGYVFTPSFQTVTLISSNLFVNFAGQALKYMLSGHITDRTGAGITAVNITLTGAASLSTVTGAGGAYQFSDLVTGDYTVTPGKSGYMFSPASRSFTGITTNQTADFIGDTIQYTISGRIADPLGAPVANADVTLTGPASA